MDDFWGIKEPYWSDLCQWRMIPADGAHWCDRSSKVQDLNSTATVETRFMQFRTCESQLELYKELTIAWYFLQKNGKVCTFVAQRFVTAPLAFNLGFEGVPVIWVKLFLVSEVLTYTGRLRKPDIGSFRFKRHFLAPLHFLHPLSEGHGTRLSISSWDEGPCLTYVWFHQSLPYISSNVGCGI